MKTISPSFAVSISAASAFPTWRRGLTVGQWAPLASSNNLPPVLAGTNSASDPTQSTYAWQGCAVGPAAIFSAAASGHDHWVNPVLKLDLNADAPAWEVLHGGSPLSAVTFGESYSDGLPPGRHTYYTQQFVSGAHVRDGIDRVMLIGCFASYYQGDPGPGLYRGGPQVRGFRLSDKTWDSANIWADTPLPLPLIDPSPWTGFGAIAKHPDTEDVYIASSKMWCRWNAATGLTDILLTYGPALYPDPRALTQNATSSYIDLNDCPSVIDAKRKRFVVMINNGGVQFQWLDIGSGDTNCTQNTLPITGAITANNYAAEGTLVHDTDNDRYLAFMWDWDGSKHASDRPIKVYAIDPDTGASSFLMNGPSVYQPDEGGGGLYSRIAHMPNLGGVAFFTRSDAPSYFLPTR